MSYIITDDSHYQAIGEALQRKRGEERTYLPSEMAAAINTIPSTIDGTDLPTQAIYWTKPDDTGRPTEIDIVNWHTDSPVTWSSLLAQNVFSRIKTIKFINCDNISSIGNSAFQSCSTLTSVTLPDSVTSIGQGAFNGCSSLASITIPNSVTSIGNNAFQNCSSLASITIPNSVTSIGNNAFQNCSSLASITIPNSVASLGNNAFQNCSSLASITIPNSVASIGQGAFNGCSSLASITIPNSVTSIGNNAFQYCSSLTDVYYAGTEEDWNSISIGTYNTSLVNATIHYNYSE